MSLMEAYDTLDLFAICILAIVLLATIQSGCNLLSSLFLLLLSYRNRKKMKTDRDRAIERFDLRRLSQVP